MKKHLPQLAKQVRNIRSITIGINLGSSMRPVGASLVSINTHPYTEKSGGLLNLLFPNSKTGLNGIAPLHSVSHTSSTGDGVPVQKPLVSALMADLAEIIEKNKYITVKKKKRLNPHYKRLKEIKFVCINIEELIELADFFTDKEKRDKLVRSNDFGKAFENILNHNNGYVEKNKILSEFSEITDKEDFVPNKDEHKRKGLELVE